jgi:hypothetical protein
MQWRGRRQSGNVSDVRGQRGGGGGAGGNWLVMMIGRVFGIKGILVVVIAGLLWAFGIVSPSMFLEGGTTSGGASGSSRLAPPRLSALSSSRWSWRTPRTSGPVSSSVLAGTMNCAPWGDSEIAAPWHSAAACYFTTRAWKRSGVLGRGSASSSNQRLRSERSWS